MELIVLLVISSPFVFFQAYLFHLFLMKKEGFKFELSSVIPMDIFLFILLGLINGCKNPDPVRTWEMAAIIFVSLLCLTPVTTYLIFNHEKKRLPKGIIFKSVWVGLAFFPIVFFVTFLFLGLMNVSP